MSDQFYVFLSSNVNNSIGVHQHNTSYNFVTHFAEKLQLNDNYEVALSEISFTKSWFNIAKPELIYSTIIDTPMIIHTKYLLPAGIYKTSAELVYAMNKIINESIVENNLMEKNPIISYDEKTDKFAVNLGYTKRDYNKDAIGVKRAFLTFSENLSNMLGFVDRNFQKLTIANISEFTKNTDTFGKITKIEAVFCPVLEPIDSLYIYSDILAPRIVGNTKASLFRQVIVSADIDYGKTAHEKFQNLYYHPLNHFEIDSIRIEIRDVTGEYVSFNKGEITITLHFRKVADLKKILNNILKK